MNIVFSSLGNIKVYLLAIGWLIVLSTYIWRFHHSPGAKQQVYLQLCKICSLIFLLLLNENNTLHNKVFLFLTFKGIMLIMPVFWFCFVWKISLPTKKIPGVLKYGYLVIVLFVLLLLFTNPWHGLVWQWFWLSGNDLVGVTGILGWSESFSALLCAYTLYLHLHWIFTSRGIRHKQAIWVFLAETISFVGIVSDIVFFTHSIPWVTLAASGCMTWCFYRWQLYNISQLAQEAVVADLVCGWLLVDEYGYIVDLNYAAKKILRELPIQIGVDFNTLLKGWPVLSELNEENKKTIETFRSYTSGRRYYEIKKILLKKDEISFGQILLFKDITLKKKDGLKVWNKKKKQSLEKSV